MRDERKRRRSEGKPYLNFKNVLVEGKTEPKQEVCTKYLLNSNIQCQCTILEFFFRLCLVSFQFSCKCKFQCVGVPYEQRKVLFHDFYALKDYVKQNSFLMGLMVIIPVKRRRHGQYDDANESRRQATVCFSLPDGNGDVVQVCRNTFMHVFGISKRRIETLVKAKKMAKSSLKKSGVIRLKTASSQLQMWT